MTPTFSVKDFDKLQHYKDRAPPWIKLYNDLLDSYEFSRLDDAARFHLLAIMLLASRSGNEIPYDPRWVSRRINATGEVDLDALVNSGFIVLNQPLQDMGPPAINPLAKRLSRGEERRGEGEREKKDGAEAPIVNLFPQPADPPSEEKSYFDRFKQICGPKSGGLAVKLKNHMLAQGKAISDARAAVETAASKSEPREYIGRILNQRGPMIAGREPDRPGRVYGDDYM